MTKVKKRGSAGSAKKKGAVKKQDRPQAKGNSSSKRAVLKNKLSLERGNKAYHENKAYKVNRDVEKVHQLSQKWSSLYKKIQEVQAKPYNMHHSYEERTPILHQSLGWGYILASRNDRLEVLFKDGIRFLISNYKA